MAKHVLDLCTFAVFSPRSHKSFERAFSDELFRLVVAKGGLVEVINKKLWREVTKGLNLPSSITSAAFTLRTQFVVSIRWHRSFIVLFVFRYMKYLYPYECEKLQLSSPTELQAAIGNDPIRNHANV